MRQYLDLCKKVLDHGKRRPNRTGVDTLYIHDEMMKFDLSEGFPLVTTKKLLYRASFAEMLGFLRGYDNAVKFRSLGCRVWDANANDNEQWLNNPKRKGTDDLGRIYGVQARNWRSIYTPEPVDQLKKVVEDLLQGIDNRREIVTHWNPAETHLMALPPCHMLYQFGIDGDRLNLCMYQRSCDMPLGVPFNIAGYAWLLSVIAHITGFRPGVFTHFLHDVHIYVNQVDGMREQVEREPLRLPMLQINPRLQTLEDLETVAGPDDFAILGYQSHPAIKYPFAV